MANVFSFIPGGKGKSELGDYELGFVDAANFPIALVLKEGLDIMMEQIRGLQFDRIERWAPELSQ